MHTKRLKTLVAFLLSFLFVANIWQVQAEENAEEPFHESVQTGLEEGIQPELPDDSEESPNASLTKRLRARLVGGCNNATIAEQ